MNLAAQGPFRVDRCRCGCVHLQLGPTTVRLAADAVPQLAQVLELAVARLAAPHRFDREEPGDPRRN